MAITLDGTTGITSPGGDVSVSQSLSGNLTFTGTGNRITGDFSNATVANNVIFQTSTANGVTYIRAMPNGTASVSGIQMYASSSDLENTSTFQTRVGLDNNECALYSNRTGTGTYLPMTFYTGGSERMRIDSSGNVGIGSSTVLGKFQVNTGSVAPSTSGNMNGVVISNGNIGTGMSLGSNDGGGYNWISSGYVNNASVGVALRIIPGSQGVQLAANGTSWTSLSDERYKTDLTPIEDAVSKVGALRSVTGRFISDEETKSRSFLIAQDVQSVFPEAVDASDPERLGVQYTEVIPLLVAAIKELKAELDTVKAELATLKGN